MARILLINDEPDLVAMCELVLTGAGHTVFHLIAPHRQDQLEAAARWNPDVVLLDLIMPALSGEEILERLRTFPRTAELPVILMSAVPETEDRAYALGAAAFLEKPFDPNDLRHAVRRALADSSDPSSQRRGPQAANGRERPQQR